MRWRTDREGLINDKEYLCEIYGAFYEVLRYNGDDEEDYTWSSVSDYRDNQITKWCPLSEILEFLNTGGSSNA